MNEPSDRIALLLLLLFVSIASLWLSGAVYFDIGGGGEWGRFLAVGWGACVVCLLAIWQPLWQPCLAVLGVSVAFLIVWRRQKPSHDREWDPSVAIMPRARRDGDLVTVENVRNFQYRTLSEFSPNYETRQYHLSNLKAADIVFFFWGSPWMSHPVLIFDFGPEGRVCISIEVRYRKGQKFSILRSFYHQQELIFLVADERDAILRRTKHSGNQEGYLYQFNAGADELRRVFLDYIDAVNDLYKAPRWYHGLFANCTTSFYRLAHSRWRIDWRVIANGRLDRALHQAGRLDQSLPFEELRKFSRINEIANSAPEEGFGDYLRRELQKERHGR
ncbi:MAG: DUF4105 domain-containing protein [Planctomycetes bacterium]|nr:DUF4105 domain-containing protein [Planctomycetota bacterium]